MDFRALIKNDNIKCLLIDMDGTLCHSDEANILAYKEACLIFGESFPINLKCRFTSLDLKKTHSK